MLRIDDAENRMRSCVSSNIKKFVTLNYIPSVGQEKAEGGTQWQAENLRRTLTVENEYIRKVCL